jgi:hypothetical protein
MEDDHRSGKVPEWQRIRRLVYLDSYIPQDALFKAVCSSPRQNEPSDQPILLSLISYDQCDCSTLQKVKSRFPVALLLSVNKSMRLQRQK